MAYRNKKKQLKKTTIGVCYKGIINCKKIIKNSKQKENKTKKMDNELIRRK